VLRRILKGAGLLFAGLAVLGVVLYQFFGLRVVTFGSGWPRPAFVATEEQRYDTLERHRAAQEAIRGPGSQVLEPASSQTQDAGTPAPRNLGTPEPGTPEPYWTGFRGPDRSGRYAEMPIVTSWPEDGLTPMWKQPVGGGYASFAVARGQAFTIEQRRGQEVVAAYDVMTGRELWTHGWDGLFREFQGGDGPRATPAWADGVVYALGALGELRALDAESGQQIWRVNILEDNGASNLEWGMAASPLVVDDLVVVLPGGRGGRSVVAYDRRSGQRVWFALDDQQAYAAPMVATLDGVRQLLVFSASRLVGLTLDAGELLWEYPWVTSFEINAAQPIVIGGNRVYVSSGYGKGAAVLEIARANGRFEVRDVWRNNRMKNRFASAVLHDGFIYGFDESIFGCIDAATGELSWKGGRYGYGQVIAAGDSMISLYEDWYVVLLVESI
jgi:outer membrane protein assembly factor BamB